MLISDWSSDVCSSDLARFRGHDRRRGQEGTRVRLENAFEVPVPPAEAWRILTDVERIVPCVPGAALTEVVDGRTYKGAIKVKLGPVALSFAGDIRFEEMDEAARRARVKARSEERRVGNEGVSKCSAGWSRFLSKKHNKK